MADLGILLDAVRAGPTRLGAVRLVTIDGPSGSGKSTFADQLAIALRELALVTVVVPTDHFATWADPFDWWSRMEAGVLRPLAMGSSADYIGNDWSSGEPVPILRQRFAPPDVLILEGVSAGRRAVAGRSTLGCWTEEPDRVLRLERAVRRDGEQTRLHLIRWQHLEDAWFASDDTKRRADLRIG